jgi:hypothetical protein
MQEAGLVVHVCNPTWETRQEDPEFKINFPWAELSGPYLIAKIQKPKDLVNDSKGRKFV